MRTVRYSLAFVVLLPLVLFGHATPASAGGVLWCKSDPIVSLNGRLVDITVGLPLEYVAHVTGPTQITIKIPASVRRHVVVNDLGYGHGNVVTFVDGGAMQGDVIPVDIRVSVPIQLPGEDSVPMELVVWPDNQLPTSEIGTNLLTRIRMDITGR